MTDPIAEIRDRLDIADLIHEYVPSLKKTGNSFKGLCPFHNEKSPSFIVFPNTQSYHCFGCGKSGDIFNFYMEMEKLDFRDALKDLGARAGVEVTTSAPRPPDEDEKRKRLIEINQMAAMWYNHILLNASQGAAGREVIADRHVSEESVRTWNLGFAPDSWDLLLNFLASRNIPAELAAEAGLATERDGGGGYYDRFRNRLMFPIRDGDGNTVGFGGRALGDAQPKYLNTAQTEIFDKSHLLYGFDLAKDAIRESGQVVIVEGYMDAIAVHEAGYRNMVASMGTALTEAQVGLLRRGNPDIILALDSDAAGQMATMRGLQTVTDNLDAELVPTLSPNRVLQFERRLKSDIRIVQLPEGKDPDEFVRKDPQSWPRIVSQALPFMDFVIDITTRNVDINDPRAKSEVVKQVLPLLRQLPDPIRENHYARQLARKLDLPESAIAEARRSLKAEARRSTAVTETAPRGPRKLNSEDYLIGLLIFHHQLNYAVLDRLEPDEFTNPLNREILRVLKSPETTELQGIQIVVGLSETLADHAQDILDSLGPRPKALGGQVVRETEQAATRLKRERHQRLVNQLSAEISVARQANDTETLTDLMMQYQRLVEQATAFAPAESRYFRDLRDRKPS
ncbi:MAG: DNA primase [Thermomicrobiales bacterium]|nr:DNA primase [Thermomicrobiales bacterium]